MNAVDYAKSQLEAEFGLLNTCAGGMTDEQYNWNPGGTCNIAAKSHVHALTAIDFFVLGTVRGEGMLWPAYASKLGLPANSLEIWKHEGTIAYAGIKEFGDKLQNETLAFVSSLSDSDLDREIETQFFGKKPVSWLLQLAGYHAVGHGGDIAAVKGMQGLKGLPF
jgi:hypothetical protein